MEVGETIYGAKRRRCVNLKLMNIDQVGSRNKFVQWLGARVALLALLVATPRLAEAQIPPPLFTSAPTLSATNHYVATAVFHWYTATGGQLTGPWQPLEGRPNWTGVPTWWKGQVKQMMRANIDVLYVHLYPGMEQQRGNLFSALNELRAEGYDTPKVAPFLDQQITWNAGPAIDLATGAGKDEFVNQYIRFYNQYYSVSTGTNADDYLARQANKPILDMYVMSANNSNVPSLTRADVSNRLVTAFGSAHPYFTNGFVMVSSVAGVTPSFADEKVHQFEIGGYTNETLYNSIRSLQIKPGYWDQNIRNPGGFLARAGGVHFSNAWHQVNRSTTQRVYLESWNEYDEGSGMYASSNTPYIASANTSGNTDAWSTTGDPFEYIKTAARGAASFNDTPAQDAKILWHNIPATLTPGESRTVTVIVRNAGNALWTAAANYKLGQADADATTLVAGKRVLINDTQDEIPLYGGIFRGRAKAFTFTLQSPATLGNYTNHFQMFQEGVAWFGGTMTNVITVKTKMAAPVTLSNLSQVTDGYNANPVTVTTTPAGLTVNLSYNGSLYPPVAAGNYTVIGIIDDVNYYGGATNTLVIPASSNPIPNWSFEANSAGTTINAPQGGGMVVDGSSITGWRLVAANSANASFSATIITNASAGKQALRLDVSAGGPSYIDQWDSPMHTPVVYGHSYLVSFDAALISGAPNSLAIGAHEFDNTGTYDNTGDGLGTAVVSSANYTHYTYMLTPQNPATAQIGFVITPSAGAVSVDNFQIVDMANLPQPWNGSFEYSPAGGVVTAPQGGGDVVNSFTLVGWRFVGVNSANASFSVSIITNASAGKQALRLDLSSGGSSWVDQWDASMQTPVGYGETYLVPKQAHWGVEVAGPTSLAKLRTGNLVLARLAH